MSYDFHGSISVTDAANGGDVITEAISKVLIQDYDEENVDEANELLETIRVTNNGMDYDGSGSEDDMGSIFLLFSCVIQKLEELYPDCSMEADCCGTNLSNGFEDIYKVQFKNRHVKEIDCDYSDDHIWCPNPDCDEWICTLGEVEFDKSYDCSVCGQHITVDEMNEILSEYVSEYDI